MTALGHGKEKVVICGGQAQVWETRPIALSDNIKRAPTNIQAFSLKFSLTFVDPE